ncbi:MAG: class I SAM-dependent RNA methyltransferase [Bacteroidales bacterium]|nr:class I SAM-dependent RNA methyltransferase [Bacteroidales bacterium]
MNVIAKTFAGLEQVLADEIQELGGENIKIMNRSVSYDADMKLLYSSNYRIRTALKILVPISDFYFKNIDEFYDNFYNIEWEKYFKVQKSFFIDSVISSSFFNNTKFAALKAKDAIVDRFRDKLNTRPSVITRNPEIKINVYVRENYCNVSLDSSGEALFKRGYRVNSGPAAINEVLAAGLVKLSGWDGKKELLDFMCGSGTIPIEGTMIGLNIPPQIKRKNFGFQHWNDYDKNLWENAVEEANNAQSTNIITVFASDISQRTLDEASENVANAGLFSYIMLRRASFDKVSFQSPKHIIFNPPYGKRIGTGNEDIFDFYKRIGDTLKNNFAESEAWMITSNMQALKNVGLRTSKKIILYNGPLESRFVKYEMYEGAK